MLGFFLGYTSSPELQILEIEKKKSNNFFNMGEICKFEIRNLKLKDNKMKEIWITLRGRGNIYWMENFTETPEDWEEIDLDNFYGLEEEGWLDGNLNEIGFILDLEGVYVGKKMFSEDEDITKFKGKYIKRTDILKKDWNLILPFYVRCINGGTEIVNTFCIELEDDEEFDPKELQLVKSDYEVEFLPYGIVSDTIIYKGKEIVMDNEVEYRDKGWNIPFVCEKFYS